MKISWHRKTIETENYTCDWKTIEIEIQLYQCWLKICWDGKTIKTENKEGYWKTIKIEIKSEIEKQFRGFEILTEFNADNKQCRSKIVQI